MKSFPRTVLRALVAAALVSSLAEAVPLRAIDGWEDLHFGVRPPEVLAEIPGAHMNLDLCDARIARMGVVRSGERCERVEGRVHLGYLPFDVYVHFSQSTGRAVRIRLVLGDPDQWSRKTYDALLRSFEKTYGASHSFVPQGSSFEDRCADQFRRRKLGEEVESSAFVQLRCEVAHEISGKGGRIALQLCLRDRCPGSATVLSRAAAAIAGMRVLDIELTAERAPGETP